MIPVIICGGVGTKMWPESRQKMPKHFLKLIGNKSLFRISYESLLGKFKPKDIFISTTVSQVSLIKQEAAEVPEANYILEPALRNTGPAIGLIAASLYKRDKDEPFVVVQADIRRYPDDKFLEMIELFDQEVRKSGKWLTGALKPNFAMAGVDYMINEEKDSRGVMNLVKWLEGTEMGVGVEQVQKYVDEGKAWLHANHYCWTPCKWLESYLKLKPEWGQPLMEIVSGAKVEDVYPNIIKGRTEDWTKLSVLAGEGLAVELPFEWMDFGTWESLDKYQGSSADKIEIEAKNNFVRSKKMVALVGVENLVVVETDDALLVCRKDQSGRVGEVVKKLAEMGKEELL